ncbi:penicillin-binding protein [Saccharopolyspora rhizosphaerae]|uniref:Penicillin-binding protein n=2 Tax=Saccharopolyspora rhizosphaerae TaxID=2492662 RepID=A0A426JKH7_9PSEU|nr:penicillin-binding protein [Saccharopolyspora rhizosphaerae]
MSAARAKRAAMWRRIRRACYVAAAAGVIIPTLVFIYGYFAWEAPDEQKLLNMKQPITITYADDSPLATVSDDGSREVVRELNQVSKPLRDATISAEDASFYTNPGFDFQGIARSVFFMFTGSGVGGGSTITQQFIKLDLELNKSDPDYIRKIKEIVLSFKITNEREKDDILLSYLNTAYYGRGANGITAAANAYFGKKPSEITPPEAAVLAGMVQRPKGNDPREDMEQATTRFNYVLDQMVKNGYLPEFERANWQAPPETRGQSDWRIDRRLTPDQFKIKDQVLRELEEAGYDEDTLAREGFKIKTTIDPKAQQAAVDAATTQAENTLPDNIKTSLVAVEPKTGAVKAYYGGGGDVGGYDWAVAPTEPGSSFKPFAVLAGLHKGLGIGEFYDGSSPQKIAGTDFANAPGVQCDIPNRCGVREAMTKSVNTVFVNIAARVGPPAVAEAAHAAGIPKEYKSGKGGTKTLQNADGQTQSGIALGMYPVKPIDMANAYATLANQGKSHTPHMVEEIVPREGSPIKIHNEPVKTLYDESESEAAKLAYNTIASMFDVADHAKRGLENGRPVMSKTGTHQYLDTKDNATAWMIGATPQLSTSVSMLANENGRNVPLEDNSGTSFYGGKYPAMVWQKFMNSYHKGLKVEQFKKTGPIGQFEDIPLPPPPTSSEPPTSSMPPTSEPSQSEQPTTSRTRPGGGGRDCGGFFEPPCESTTSEPGDVAPTRDFGN